MKKLYLIKYYKRIQGEEGDDFVKTIKVKSLTEIELLKYTKKKRLINIKILQTNEKISY